MKSANITQLDAISEIVCPAQVDNIDDYVTPEQFANYKKISYSNANIILKNAYDEGKLDRIKLRADGDRLRYYYKVSDITNKN